jgi:hypothetical protein
VKPSVALDVIIEGGVRRIPKPPLKDLNIAENVAAGSHHYQIGRDSCLSRLALR